MFVKAVRVRDVRPGDVVLRTGGEHIRISGVGVGVGLDGEVNGLLRLYIEGCPGLSLSGTPDQMINLVHRSLPEGKIFLDVLHEIARLGLEVQPGLHKGAASLEEAIIMLREACEEFELAKPPLKE